MFNIKNLSKFALGLVLFTGLTACGNNNATPTNDAATTNNVEQTQDASVPQSGEVTNIEYWHVNAETQGGQTIEELVEEFNSTHDDIHVTARFNPDMYKGLMQNLQAEQAAGNTPALIQVGWAFLEYFSNNFEYVTPQDAIDQYDTEDSTFLTDNFLPNVLELAVNNEGEQVGIPYSLSNPVLYINRDLMEEAGLGDAVPETWEEVKEMAKQVTEKTGKYGFYQQEPSDFWAQQAAIESNGGQMIEVKDGKSLAAFATPEGFEAMQLFGDMINVDKSALHIGWDEGLQAFSTGDIAMYYTTIAKRAAIEESATFKLETAVSPGWEGKEKRLPAGGAFLAITATDPKQIEAAWEFEKFLYSVESMAAWTKGTGYVPPRDGVAEAENGLKAFLAENELMKPAIEQMANLVPWASFPGDAGLQAEQMLLDMRDKIFGGNQSAEEAMTQAQEDINRIME